YGSR
ncbi:YD repeat-containing domain protein, partial [Escherichia coli PA4]